MDFAVVRAVEVAQQGRKLRHVAHVRQQAGEIDGVSHAVVRGACCVPSTNHASRITRLAQFVCFNNLIRYQIRRDEHILLR